MKEYADLVPDQIHQPDDSDFVRPNYERTFVEVGDTFMTTLPWSEVCMHMHVAGERMTVTLVGDWAAQLRNTDGSNFSFAIGSGEAGVYYDATGHWVNGLTPVADRNGNQVVREPKVLS